MNYFRKYLEVTPLALAIWRAQEAKALSLALKTLNLKIQAPLLDLGCGFGEFSGVYFNNMIEVGIDINQKNLILAASKKKYQKLIWADAKTLSFEKNTFQTIISISVLEHIAQVEKVFISLKKILKPKGLLIFTVPTKQYDYNLYFPFLKKYLLKIFHKIYKHQKLKSTQTWKKYCLTSGFKIIYCQGTISPKQIRLFQWTMLLAAPSQIFQKLFTRRLLFKSKIRDKILYKLFNKFINNENLDKSNIIIIAQKL